MLYRAPLFGDDNLEAVQEDMALDGAFNRYARHVEAGKIPSVNSYWPLPMRG